jgi:hypothetical protein
LYGTWHTQGVQPFSLLDDLKCHVYTWQGPASLGDFHLTFYCPCNEEPRRFFCEPVLRSQLYPDSESAALDEICVVGLTALLRLECFLSDSPPSERETQFATDSLRYRFHHAIFQGRLRGHAANMRRLVHRRDFIHSQGSDRKQLLIPSRIADIASGKVPTGFEMITELQRVVGEQENTILQNETERYPINAHMGRGQVDHFLIDGLDRRTATMTFDETCNAVSKCLIAKSELTEDYALSVKHKIEYRHFLERLLKSFRKLNELDFDRWLETEREKGFLRLYPNWNNLGKPAADTAKPVASTFYRLQLWAAYQQAARAYGALMLLVWVDFCADPQLAATPAESFLFSIMHRPQFFLGGLPLAFLTRVQFPWILRPLVDCLNEVTGDPERYEALTRLLALYGEAAQQRRGIDREAKASAKRPVRNLDESGERVADRRSRAQSGLDDPERFPEINSPKCDTCGETLAFFDQFFSGRWIVVEVECRHCDTPSKTVRIDSMSASAWR